MFCIGHGLGYLLIQKWGFFFHKKSKFVTKLTLKGERLKKIIWCKRYIRFTSHVKMIKSTWRCTYTLKYTIYFDGYAGSGLNMR